MANKPGKGLTQIKSIYQQAMGNEIIAMGKRIAVIHSNDGTDVRVGKFCRSLSRMNNDIHFIGWDRRPKEHKSPVLSNCTMHLLVLETQYGKPTLFGTVKFAFHIACVLAKIRPAIICCVNEDNTLLALPWHHIFYRNIISDIHDELMNRKSHHGGIVYNIFRGASFIARLGADKIITVDETRYAGFGRFRAKCTIIENYPEDPGPELAIAIPKGPIRIYVCGALHIRRGLKQILTAVERSSNVEIVSAGGLFDRYAQEVFAKHPAVKYHGIVDSHESIRLAAACDAVYAFYEPTSINNLQASPNKIFDAMSVGRPVLINAETLVSKWVIENSFGLSCPYYDTDALSEIIWSLKDRRPMLHEYAARVRADFVDRYVWSRLEHKLAKVFYMAERDDPSLRKRGGFSSKEIRGGHQ